MLFSAWLWQDSPCGPTVALLDAWPQSSRETLHPVKQIRLEGKHYMQRWQYSKINCIEKITVSVLTVSVTLEVANSSARFSRALTHTFRFCRQREAAARFRSRKRRLRSSGSMSAPRRLRPPFGGAGETCRTWHGLSDQLKSRINVRIDMFMNHYTTFECIYFYIFSMKVPT